MKKFEEYILNNSDNLIICIRNSRPWDLKTEIFKKYKKIYVFQVETLQDYENLIHGMVGDYLVDSSIDTYVKKRIIVNNR
jgi:hypothetical protein